MIEESQTSFDKINLEVANHLQNVVDETVNLTQGMLNRSHNND